MVVGFIRVRVGYLSDRRVHSGLRGITGPSGRSGSRGFTLARLGVVAFIWVRVGSMGRT